MSLGTFPRSGIDIDVTSFYDSPKPSPQYSYLYNSNRSRYTFDDPEIGKFSYIQEEININGKPVCLTINETRVIHYDGSFFYSLSDFSKKIHLPQQLDQDLLDKIALIANYLAGGEECEYEKGTAQILDNDILYRVKNEIHYCRARLFFSRDHEHVSEDVQSQSSLTTNVSSSPFLSQSRTPSNPAIRASRSTSDGKTDTDSEDPFDKFF